MIYGHVEDSMTDTLSSDMLACLKMAALFETGNPGSYPIDGDRVFVNIVEYPTVEEADRFWEAHRSYLDLHLMLEGEERIALGRTEIMEQKDYVEADDFLPVDGEACASVILRPGDFLVCYPEDAHMTALKADESIKIRKAIFKIRIDPEGPAGV